MTLFIDKIQSISVYFFITIRSIRSPNSQMQMWPLSYDRHLVSMFSLTAWASRTALSLTAVRDVLRGQAPNCILINLMFFSLFSQAQCFFFNSLFLLYFPLLFIPFPPLPPPLTPLYPQSPQYCPCLWVLFLFSLILPPPRAVSLLSMSVSLFCLLVQFVH